MDSAIKQETGVWFFTAYHILREGAKEALEKCAEGKADDAADILKDVLDDAEGFFYDSIDKYVEENPVSHDAFDWLMKDIKG